MEGSPDLIRKEILGFLAFVVCILKNSFMATIIRKKSGFLLNFESKILGDSWGIK